MEGYSKAVFKRKILLSRPERIPTGNDLQIIYRIILDYKRRIKPPH